ncbi:MAG: right-handed parallel beta-helix repeat-containing protein [Phycisphaerales bacterium]|nr:right-handed parallel beta-helix repeat-containing protein [Phycisphaerales bacterium]
MMLTPMLLLSTSLAASAPPEITVTTDNTVITASCRVVIPAGTVIEDADDNGVIQVKGDNITVEFAQGSELRGAAKATLWDQFKGVGLAIDGGRRVTIKGAAVHGYKVGIRARKTSGLTIDTADVSDNYRQRLKSTPQAEDGADWLFPHNNDKKEWSTQHGAGILVEESQQATIRNVKCRRGQNGIMLDRVTDSKIYDNDCSFLSGWGLSMWRSGKNIVTRNAFDFCVRGHVEGVYNRGQDSAGILMFEQCSNNTIAENSVTHGGDGFFGFAGSEALGEGTPPANFSYVRKGCNDNLFLRNDFSYAAAHGLELTFSYGNKIVENRFVENAICGIWGGYSQDTIITQNQFTGNGGMAYGLERGGINMEHAANNKIFDNSFLNNKVAVHLWWDNDAALFEKPGVKKNYKGVSGNVIAENDVTINNQHPFRNLPADAPLYAWQFRDAPAPAGGPDAKSDPKSPARSADKQEDHFKNNQISQNVVLIEGVNAIELQAHAGLEFKTSGPTPRFTAPRVEILGQSKPVVREEGKVASARTMLAGRDKIIMDEWGPWDHESPLLRATGIRGGTHTYDVLGAGSTRIQTSIQPTTLVVSTQAGIDTSPARVTVTGGNTVTPYTLTIKVPPDFERTVTGTLMPVRWNITFFPWADAADPRNELEAWRQLATSPEAKTTITGDLALRFGMGGPKDLKLARNINDSNIGPDRFGTLATTRMTLPAGKWRLWTMSDDGIRVLVNGKVLFEDWTWHAPKRDAAEFTQDKEGPVDIKVEHFEIDGFSVLELGLEPVQ